MGTLRGGQLLGAATPGNIYADPEGLYEGELF